MSPFTLHAGRPEAFAACKALLTFAACKACTLGVAGDACPTDPKKIVMKLDVNVVRASAQQLKRVAVDSERNNMHLLTCADEVLA